MSQIHWRFAGARLCDARPDLRVLISGFARRIVDCPECLARMVTPEQEPLPLRPIVADETSVVRSKDE